MEKGIWVVVRNSLGCEIFREFVAGSDVYGATMRNMIAENGLTFVAGDSIAFEEGESEKVD